MRIFFRHDLSLILFFVAAVAIVSPGCSVLKDTFKSDDSDSLADLTTEDPLDPLSARKPRRLLLEDLSPGQLATTINTKFGGSKTEDDARRDFEEGQQIYQQATEILANAPEAENPEASKLFIQAANLFRSASAAWPESSLAEEAFFFEGESYFFANHYVQANRAYEGLISEFSGTRHLDKAEERRFSIANYWLELEKAGARFSLNDPKRPKYGLGSEAIRILHRIRIDDPTGKLADDATFALGSAYLSKRKYEDAADTFSYLRKDYPGSKHQFNAQMLELESLLKSYRGADYDGTPLLQATKLRDQILRQFPEEASKHTDILDQQKTLIENQLAQRDFELGQFYERRGENLAARIYYEKVQSEYENSVFHEGLGERIADVSSKPAVPEPPAKWLTDLFPNENKDEPIPASGGSGTVIR